MNLYTINTGFFKLDGGAMFGVVPKSLWAKLNPPDNNNMCTWAMRCLLIEEGNRLILIDNGIGNKQDDKFFSYYFLHGDDTLDKSLAAFGFHRDDITDMLLSHLHFDHCGGSIEWNKDRTAYQPAFKNATYWSNENHWKWATQPNAREKASFLKENILPIQESGQLKFLDNNEELIPGVKMRYFNGHTDAMMCPHIQYKGKTVVFAADMLPSAAHVPVPYVMAYDTRPLVTLDERNAYWPEAAKNEYIMFLEHDKDYECCTLQNTERGIKIGRTLQLNEL